MPTYRRAYAPGGTFFFTLVTYERQPLFSSELARTCLREAIRIVRADNPFEILGICLLPDHLHCIWQLPTNDGDFSTRWARIKKSFTQRWREAGGPEPSVSLSRQRHREGGLWQRRFWEHLIRDERDLIRHLDYIHYNPVKHGLAVCPHDWPYSSFLRWVERNRYALEWKCSCGGRQTLPPDFTGLDQSAME